MLYRIVLCLLVLSSVAVSGQGLQLDLVFNREGLYGKSLVYTNNELLIGCVDDNWATTLEERYYGFDLNGIITDSLFFTPPNGAQMLSLAEVNGRVFAIAGATGSKILLFNYTSGSLGSVYDSIRFNYQSSLIGYAVNNLGNILFYGHVDTSALSDGSKTYPFVTEYNYQLKVSTTKYFFDRGRGFINGFTPLIDGTFFMSCAGCKKYQNPLGGIPNSNGFGDIAFYDANYFLSTDTAPLVEYWSGFPFIDFPRRTGPNRISGAIEMPDQSVVFIGVFSDSLQVASMNRDMVIARWDRNLNKLKQTFFGLPNATDYIYAKQHIVKGFDNYIYTCVYTHWLDSLLGASQERQRLLISKFDTALNLLSQSTFDTGDRMEFGDMISTPNGVYVIANKINTQLSSFGSATVFRIRNSGWALDVEKPQKRLEPTIYPNPGKDVRVLESVETLKGYSIYDVNGRKLREMHFDAQNSIELNTSDLASGTYVLVAHPEKANLAVKPLRLIQLQ